MTGRSPAKIAIIGSCVTRDAFEYAPSGSYELSAYVARTSLAGVGAPPLVDVDLLERIQSRSSVAWCCATWRKP